MRAAAHASTSTVDVHGSLSWNASNARQPAAKHSHILGSRPKAWRQSAVRVGAKTCTAAGTGPSQRQNSAKGSGKRGAAGKPRPASGIAGQALLTKLASKETQVSLSEAQQGLAAVRGSPDGLWSLYSALRGRVAGGLDAKCVRTLCVWTCGPRTRMSHASVR